MENKSEIRIYAACLAAYNNGILHGAWIDAAQEPQAIRQGIARMLKLSPIENAEEWAIHDFEGFEGVSISEYADIGIVAKLAAFIAEHGRLGAELIAHFGEIEEARMALEDRYHGSYASVADYAEQFTEETTDIPQVLRSYIDWEAMARDWEIGGDIITIETAHDEVHIFSGC